MSNSAPIWIDEPNRWLKSGAQRLTEWFGGHAEKGISVFVVCLLFFGFAGQGFRYALGYYGSAIPMAFLFLGFFVYFIAGGRHLPIRRFSTLVSAFVGWCCLSILWSFYPFDTAVSAIVTVGITLVGVGIGVAVPLSRMVGLLALSFKWILGVSYALELFVSLVLHHKLAPPSMRNWERVPEMYYWVNNLLFEGGPIQGFMGNRNPLSFVALLLIICMVAMWRDGRARTWSTLIWIGIAILTLALTQSATTTMAAVGVSGVTAGLWIIRHSRPEKRRAVVWILTAVVAFIVVGTIVGRRTLMHFLQRSPDMTGRGEIWEKILPMWAEKPLLGWGWTIGWPKDIEPFAHLVPRADGTPTTQAHNAYIEALFQTGFIGAFLLCAIVALLLIRSLGHAVTMIEVGWEPAVPLLLMTAMVVQSISESRLLFEGNWMLLVCLATWAKLRTGILIPSHPLVQVASAE